MIIDGIFHSNDFEKDWIIKKDGKYYTVPVQCIKMDDLHEVKLDNTALRPVGKYVERLLLDKSDMTVRRDERHVINTHVETQQKHDYGMEL